MELFYKVVFGVILATSLSSDVLCRAPAPSKLPNRVEILITLGLAPRVVNATQEMKNVHPFITSTNNLQETMLMLGVVVTKACSLHLQLKDKYTIAYMKLSNYISPLYMAYSYEAKQGPQHIQLAKELTDTSFYLNSTVTTLRHELLSRKFPLPEGQTILTEGQLNQYTREYLQILVKKKLLTLVITDDVVKIYRNYVILYTLQDVISELSMVFHLTAPRGGKMRDPGNEVGMTVVITNDVITQNKTSSVKFMCVTGEDLPKTT